MNKLLSVVIICIAAYLVSIHMAAAQNQGLQNPVLSPPLYGEDADGRIIEIPLPAPKLEGSTYIYDPWRLGDIQLTTGERIKGQWIRYDLFNHQMEIKSEGEVKVLKSNRISNGSWLDPDRNDYIPFVHASTMEGSGLPGEGILEILVDDQAKLMVHTGSKIIESNYLPQLAAGNRNDRIKKQRTYYLDYKGELRVINAKKKENQELFSEFQPAMDSFNKQKKLSYKVEPDLVQMVQQLNSLLE